MGVQIRENTSRIDISYGELITKNQINNVERLSNQASTDNRKVINWLSSRKEIEEKYGKSLGLTEITPSGHVRVVEVQGWDIALCSGTHVKSTAEIGLITILDKFRLKKGVERIEFTAGKQAYRSYNDSMKALKDTAQTLSTSISEVPVRVKNLLKERDKLKKVLSNLQDQLIEFHILKLQSEAPEFECFKLLIKELPPLDSQKLKKIAVKLTEKDPYQIVVLGTKTEKSAFLVGAIGEAAVRAGLDIGIQINNVARILKGGGGGNQKLAQAGGKAPEKINEALKLLTTNVKDKLHKAKKNIRKNGR
jgi:alanyl-tRNA synthetase